MLGVSFVFRLILNVPLLNVFANYTFKSTCKLRIYQIMKNARLPSGRDLYSNKLEWIREKT